jgi:hypothetical protein
MAMTNSLIPANFQNNDHRGWRLKRQLKALSNEV